MEAVVVTGLGVVSPVGCSVQDLVHCVTPEASATRCQEGSDGLSIADMPLQAIPKDKRARIGRLDRLCRLLLSASYLAVDAAALAIAHEDSSRIGLSFGTGLGCLLTNAEYYEKLVEQGAAAASPRLFAYTVSSAAAGEVSIALGITGPNVTTHMGFASGLGAIGCGFDMIQLGKADVVLAGGADANGPALIQALRDMGLLKARDQSRPFHDSIPGVWPSEGAVVAVLERADRARKRGARCWGRISGYAAGFEPTLTRQTRHCTGVAETMRRALGQSSVAAADVDVVCASAHGTPVDVTEREALVSVFGTHRPSLVLAPKLMLGDAFGASGVLSLALAAGLLQQSVPLREGIAFGPRDGMLDGPEAERRLQAASVVMVNALCYSGNIVTLVFRRE